MGAGCQAAERALDLNYRNLSQKLSFATYLLGTGHSCIYSFIHSLYPLTHVFMPSFSHLLFHSGTHQAFRCSLLHSCIQSFAQSPTSLNTHTFIHSVTHSLTAIHVLPPHQPGQPLPASLVLSLQPEHQIPPNFMVQPRVPQHCAELTS